MQKIRLDEVLNKYETLLDVSSSLVYLEDSYGNNILNLLEKCLNEYTRKNETDIRIENIIGHFLKIFNCTQYNDLVNDLLENLETLTTEQVKQLIFVMQRPNYYHIKSLNDVENFEVIQNESHNNILLNLQDTDYVEEQYREHREKFREFNTNDISVLKQIDLEPKDVVLLKTIILQKAFKQDYFSAKSFLGKYGNNLEELGQIVKDSSTVEYMKSLQTLFSITNIDELIEIYNQIEENDIDFLQIENNIKSQYQAMYSAINFNPPENTPNFYDGKTPVYDTPDIFFMTVTSFGGVFSLDDNEDNYKTKWEQIDSQIVSTSFISNNYIATAPVRDVVFGMTGFDNNSEFMSGKQNLFVQSGYLNPAHSAGVQTQYYTPWALISETKKMPNVIIDYDENGNSVTAPNINEKVYRRNDENGNRVLPSYVVYFSNGKIDKNDPIWQKSSKAASDFNIPIVVIDKERLTNKEMPKEKLIKHMNEAQPNTIYSCSEKLLNATKSLNEAVRTVRINYVKKYFPDISFTDSIYVASNDLSSPPRAIKKDRGQLMYEREKLYTEVEQLFEDAQITPKERYKLKQTIDKLYKAMIDNVQTNKIDEKNISINRFTRNALNSGVRTETVKEADTQLPSPKTTEKGTEQKSNNLADLEEFIDFIDPNMIDDSRFLALLRKYRTEDLSPEEYVSWVEENYKKQIEQTSIEPVDNTEETIR